MCDVFIDGKPQDIDSSAELRSAIENSRTTQFGEIVLVVGSLPEHALTLMLNHEKASLFYSQNIDEHSFSSRNPFIAPDTDEEVEFLLSNGQMDAYPASWVVPATIGIDAICHFFDQRKLSENVSWHQEF